MLRKQPHRRSRRPPTPIPAPTEEVVHDLDPADRRDRPDAGHANLGPDDRAARHLDDIESEGPERDPDVDVGVIDSVSRVDAP